MQQNVDVSDTKYDEADSSLLVNNLIYEMPKALSLCVDRKNILQYPQRSTYAVGRNTTIIFDWNTGNSYIDPYNSFLKFKMTAIAPVAVAPPTFGSTSALNLIHETRIRSRSGVELDRCENSNLYNAYRIKYTKSEKWSQTVGSTFFCNSAIPIFSNPNLLQTEVCIPLSEISSFFRPMKKQLIPCQLASGLRIELSLESLQKAFVDATGYFGASSSLELRDIHMSLASSNLSDETLKLLNLESSQSGLEYVYTRIYSYANTYDAGITNFTLQVSKAVSQAQHVFAVIQSNVVSNSATVDSFLSEVFSTTSYQWRLGSAYYPHVAVQSAIDTTVNRRGIEPYLLTLSSFDKMQREFQESTVTLDLYSQSIGILATVLTRDSSLQVSGSPINNSRLLELIVSRDGSADGVAKRDVNCFLEYISVARTYIDNVAVAI
jgi:hypothetical protein